MEDRDLEYMKKRNWSKEEFNAYMRTIERYIISPIINKEKLMELRKLFTLSTDYWYNIIGVNCYGYALGIDLPTECFNFVHYCPGCFYEAINQTTLMKTKENLIERLGMDFETLEIEYRIVSPEEEIADNEWKIALFNDITLSRTNYHFLRQGKDGTWYHKMGYKRESIPTNKDHNGNIITNPLDACFRTSPLMQGRKMYEYNRCYSLKMR